MRAAFRLLTVLPARGEQELGPRAAVAFPLVGVMVGLVWLVAGRSVELFPRTTAVAAALVLLADAVVTGAVHLRGLAAVVDAAAAGDAEASLRPQPLTATGAVALVLVSLLRFSVLIFGADFGYRIVTAPLAGRAAMLWLLWRLPGGTLARPTPLALALATGLTLLGTVPAGGRGFVGLAVALAVAGVFTLWWRERFGAANPAGLAAVGLLAETVALLSIAGA